MTEDQKQTLRLLLDKYVWPGGYPVFGTMKDGGIICSECANKEVKLIVSAMKNQDDPQWELVATEANWEDEDLHCDHCNRQIESAYGE